MALVLYVIPKYCLEKKEACKEEAIYLDEKLVAARSVNFMDNMISWW